MVIEMSIRAEIGGTATPAAATVPSCACPATLGAARRSYGHFDIKQGCQLRTSKHVDDKCELFDVGAFCSFVLAQLNQILREAKTAILH